MNDTVRVINLTNGQVGDVRLRLFRNPAINTGQLIEVKPGVKSFQRELYKPMTAEEFIKKHPTKVVNPPEPETVLEPVEDHPNEDQEKE